MWGLESTGNSARERERDRGFRRPGPGIGKEWKPDYAYPALKRSTKQGVRKAWSGRGRRRMERTGLWEREEGIGVEQANRVCAFFIA